MGIDVAAASSLKWLFGVYGAGFVYVRRDHEGTALTDRVFPGHVSRDYPPWTTRPIAAEPFRYTAPSSAARYEPGHVSNLGYAAVYEGLGFIQRVGGPAAIQRHAARLLSRLLEQLDTERFRVITPEPGRTPILAVLAQDVSGIRRRLDAAKIVLGIGGDLDHLVRISPAGSPTG